VALDFYIACRSPLSWGELLYNKYLLDEWNNTVKVILATYFLLSELKILKSDMDEVVK
jgi:hypothetical protein